MAYEQPGYKGMTLYTPDGERKYLSAGERKRFLNALDVLGAPEDRTFCEMLYWTGCRPSEALGVCPRHVDIENAAVIIRSLKKRGEHKGRHFRAIPVPRAFVKRLIAVHRLNACMDEPDVPLWRFSRTTAWKRVRRVMEKAGISGSMACARGLRHAYGIHAALARVPETRIKKWMGHAHIATTEIYLDMAAPEDRAMARRMWSTTAAG